MGKLDNNLCANCGADSGLHRFDTLQCPQGGVEETRFDRYTGKYLVQQWEETVFLGQLDAVLEKDAKEIYQQCEKLSSELFQENNELRELSEGFKESALGKDKQIADLKGQVQQLREALGKVVRHGLIEKDGYQSTIKIVWEALKQTAP